MNALHHTLRNMLLMLMAGLMLAVSLLLMAGAAHAWFTVNIASRGNMIAAAESWSTDSGQQAEPAESGEPASEVTAQPGEDAITTPAEGDAVVPEPPTASGEPANSIVTTPEEPAGTEDPESTSQPADSTGTDDSAGAPQADTPAEPAPSDVPESSATVPPQGEQ